MWIIFWMMAEKSAFFRLPMIFPSDKQGKPLFINRDSQR
jgi:hypothetical protein